MSQSFTNVYYKRTAGTARACYVCYRPTTTVLATINTVDFLYTCPGHLADRGFATSLGVNETQGVKMSEDEIARIKEEWEEKQRKKEEKEKEEKKSKEKEKDKPQTDDTKDNEGNTSKSPKVPGSLSVSPTPTPTHERYALHRDYFAMRLAEHRKRKQTALAKDLAPRLPGAPNGVVLQEKY